MEKFDERKNIPELEIHIDSEGERREILERFKNNLPVLFILSKNYDLHLSSIGHDGIRRSSGFEHLDQLAEGLIRVNNDVITVQPRDKTTNEIESAIMKAVNTFLAD